jgi:hypothetical protein
MTPQPDEPRLETLEDLAETLVELQNHGLIEAWPSRETRYFAATADTDEETGGAR